MKEQVDKAFQQKQDEVNNKEYKVMTICDILVYNVKLKDYLPSIYYLVLWKSYLEEENIRQPASVIQHFQRLVTTFYKNYSEKPTATSPQIDSAPPMV